MPGPVALQRCADYSPSQLEPALDAALAALGGLAALVQPGQRVLLKPNLIAGLPPERAATTHPALLGSLCRRILELGATPFIGDAPAWGGPRSVAEATGVAGVCDQYGVEFIFFDRHTSLPSARPDIAPRFHVDPRVLEADVVLNVGKLKAHQQLGFTCSMKSLYGCLAGREKAYHHFARSKEDAVFARFLAAYQASLPVTANIVDAVVAMEGAGPRLGLPRQLGVIAAGRSAVETDAVMAAIIGVPATHRLMLDAAAALELGETDVGKIPTAGETVAALAVDDFVFPELIGVFFSPWRLVRGWLRNRALMRRERTAA